jgi:peptide/nickel transport system permease protein
MQRITGYAITLLLAISLNFWLPRAMPGDPLALIAGEAARQMNAAQIAELRHAYGLDRPLLEQFAIYLGRLLQADPGQSYRYSGGQSVAQILLNRLGWTLFLVLMSLTLATMLGGGLGAWAAWQRSKARDWGLVAILFTLRSAPPFWVAMILIPLFAVQSQLFPSGDSYSFPRPGGLAGLLDVLHHAVLPVSVLTLSYTPVAFAITRSALLGVLHADYIRTARAKGLHEQHVLFRHALRNALLPLVTAIALDFGQLLGGVTLIETVFNYRGIGGMMFDAVKSRDYPLLQGGFLVFTASVLLINLVTDWLYGRFDPRLRAGGNERT